MWKVQKRSKFRHFGAIWDGRIHYFGNTKIDTDFKICYVEVDSKFHDATTFLSFLSKMWHKVNKKETINDRETINDIEKPRMTHKRVSFM